MMKRIGIGILVFGFVLAMGTAAQAVPELGVGTGTFACGGATEYYECFSGASGSGHGFIIGSSPAPGTVWADADAFGTGTSGADIWLIGDSSFSGSVTFAVGATNYNFSSLGNVGTFGSYATPYYGVNLGGIDENPGWVQVNVPGLWPNNGGNDTYMLSGSLTYPGTVTPGNWLFVVAAVDGLDGTDFGASGHDQFSPKTTSAFVPEPGTVLLLGSGLLGLVLYRRKFQA